MRLAQLVVYVTTFLLVTAQAINNKSSTLVVYDSRVTLIDRYTKLFSILKEEYPTTFTDLSEEDSVPLYVNDRKLYDNVILFPSKAKKISQEIDVRTLIEFSEDKGNVIVVSSPRGLQDEARLYLNELGIYPSPRGYKLVDHFNGVNEEDDVVMIPECDVLNKWVSTVKLDGLKYSGSVAKIDNGELLVPVLRAPETSYAYNTADDSVTSESAWAAGSQGYLAVGFQAQNNARSMWIGSDSILTDDEINSDFVADVLAWTFQTKSVIQVESVTHSHADKALDGRIYKVTDEIIYSIALKELKGGVWVPFLADDIQLEVAMLDPYYRVTLHLESLNNDSACYTTGTLSLPDQHGMFTLRTSYRRSGLSFIEESQVVTVRHMANDEYKRSWEITNSWVYLTSASGVFISWFIFIVLHMYTGERSVVSETKKKN